MDLKNDKNNIKNMAKTTSTKMAKTTLKNGKNHIKKWQQPHLKNCKNHIKTMANTT